MKVAVWTCQNCGHEVDITDDLEGLNFSYQGHLVSKLGCKACDSYTLQRATDDTFTAGEFLVVKTKNKIRGK